MAQPPSILLSKKGPKYADPWHERYNQPTFHLAGPHVISNIAEGGPQNPTLNKLPNQRVDPNNISLKSNASNERKCQVYVHHISKIPTRSNTYVRSNWQSGSQVHQNMYKHEASDFYNAKMRTLQRQFDNLSLNSKRVLTGSPNRLPKVHNTQLAKYLNHEKMNFYNQASKIPQIKSNLNSKEINKALLFKAEHKLAFDKLEESYWAKWKPNKAPPAKDSQPKLKGLYTENDKIENTYHIANRSGRKERGDSNETVRPVASLEKNVSETSNADTVDTNLFYVVTEPDEAEQEASVEEKPEPLLDENLIDVSQEAEDQKVEKQPSNVVVAPIEVIQEEDLECNVNILKHTDSFILTAKKQSKEKPHFQQPKCIKLFKNVGYTTTATVNHVKGGSYPLKSCMRRKSSGTKPFNLGRPGSPVRGATMRRPGKANRFT